MEYAFPENKIEDAVEVTMKICKKYQELRSYIRAFQVVIRPIARDKRGYLSLSKRDENLKTFCIDLQYQTKDKTEIEFYKELENEFLNLGGRVTPSRLFWNLSPSAFKNYPDFDKFIKVKKELDPDNIFGNNFSDSILFGKNENKII